MTETAGEHLTEEPQSERGPMGSRDTGSDEPSAGPVDRPEGGPRTATTTRPSTRRGRARRTRAADMRTAAEPTDATPAAGESA